MAEPASTISSRLSCADSAFPRLSHETALAVIADLGLDAVDICVFRVGHTQPDAVRESPGAVAGAVRGRLAKLGLSVSDVFLILAEESLEDYAVNHPDPDVRAESLAYFASAVELARALGAPGLTILPGMPFEDSESSLELAARELERRVEIAGNMDLALAIEPHYQSIVQTPDRTLELLKRVPDLRLALDHSHFIYQGIPQVEVDALIPHARHVHLRQARPGAMQLPARDGTIDFPQLLERLGASGYDGFLCLEYQWDEWLECNRVDCISETAELRDLLLAETDPQQRSPREGHRA